MIKSLTERCFIRDTLKHELHSVFIGYSVKTFLSSREIDKIEAVLYKPGKGEIIIYVHFNYGDINKYIQNYYPELLI